AVDVDAADLPRGHAQRRVLALTAEQLDADAGRAGQLGSAAGPELHAVDRGADRDVAQRQVVARLDVRARPGLDPVALLEVLRRDDVALLAVEVVQQRDAGGAVRVVLDVGDLGRHAVLVVAPEVDHAVLPLVTATLMAGGDPAVHVAAALLGQRLHERLLRRGPGDLGEVGDARATTARGHRLVFANRHLCLHPSADRAAEGLDPVTVGELHHRPLRVLALAPPGAGALALALTVEGVHGQDPDVEDLLDRDLDLGLVGFRVNHERVPV